MTDYKKLIATVRQALNFADRELDENGWYYSHGDPRQALTFLEAILDEMLTAVREYAVTVNNDDVDAHQRSVARLERLAALEGGEE